MARGKNKIYWQAFSVKDRNSAIEEIKDTISKNDGYIINFTAFSDLALMLTIEIEENRISSLYKVLSGIVKITEVEPEDFNINSKLEWWILINISFSEVKGNLKVQIPNVPG